MKNLIYAYFEKVTFIIFVFVTIGTATLNAARIIHVPNWF